jgi:plasmid stabilization system protein ParE
MTWKLAISHRFVYSTRIPPTKRIACGRMKYEVRITSRAQREAQANHDWWAENRSAEQAARWYNDFLNAALSLERNPEGHAVAAENDRFPYEIRQLNFGIGRKPTHGLVYAIRPKEVVILRVRYDCRSNSTAC